MLNMLTQYFEFTDGILGIAFILFFSLIDFTPLQKKNLGTSAKSFDLFNSEFLCFRIINQTLIVTLMQKGFFCVHNIDQDVI